MQPREDRFTIKAFDCCPDGRVKPSTLMQYLQEAAARHAEQLGVGFAALEQRNCFWVLADFRLEIATAPRWTDNLTIKTWPSGFTRLMASREFIGERSDGQEFFRATSQWMILDKQSGRPKNLTRLELHLPPNGPKALTTELQRLQAVEGYARADALRVPFSSLDFNGHVNNTEYIRWALDGLYSLRRAMPEIHVIQATYLAEVFEGDAIEILVAADREGPTHILERQSAEPAGANVFLMEIFS